LYRLGNLDSHASNRGRQHAQSYSHKCKILIFWTVHLTQIAIPRFRIFVAM
jgi:hypothetical protein